MTAFCVCSAVNAKDIRIGVTNSTPPYYIDSSKSGVEINIINAALESSGHKIITY